MNAVVIVKDDSSSVRIPVTLSDSEIASKGIKNGPIESIDLPIRLGMCSKVSPVASGVYLT
jgi:hypothetical protein